MKEFTGKKKTYSSAYKKEERGSKTNRTFRDRKKTQETDNDGENNSSKSVKRYSKTSFPRKTDNQGKNKSLVKKIKKSFDDFNKESKTSSSYNKSSTSGFKPKKTNYKDWEDKENKEKDDKSNLKKDFTRDKKNQFSKKPFRKKIGKSTSIKKEGQSEDFIGAIRLNRYIAASGICSRREADELIQLGEVKVNGVVVTEMGIKVNPTDRVEVGGQSISPEKKVYILLNKPKDFVSTVSDPHAEKTVLDLVKLAGPERIYPVGRLDRNTTGVMLLTNDGDLTKKLTHPSYNKKKVYHVGLDKPLTKANLQQIIDGFELEDGFINADAISFIDENDKTQVGIEIHSGRNRIVRRIFEYLGFTVVKLDRVYFAGLTKKNIARGKWRYLSDKEISMLKRGAYE